MNMLSIVTILTLSSVAYADDFDDLFGEEEPATEAPARIDDADDVDLLDDEAADDEDSIETGEDLLDSDPNANTSSGSDSADVYRDQQKQVKGLAADEEILAWEEYLARHPMTVFRSRIDKRIDVLMGMLYGTKIVRSSDASLDADNREISFSQGILLESVNPRTRLQAGFEWGLPQYMNLMLDYEHQFHRSASGHWGIRHRQTGWSLETGARYAAVKSSRTKSILTLIGDLRINTNEFFFAPRPQVAYGQKIGNLDMQIQTGVELDTRENAGVPIIGGANFTYHTTDRSAVFLESAINMKSFDYCQNEGSDIDCGDLDQYPTATTEELNYRFNTASFGIKMYPKMENGQIVELNFGASIPFLANYWMSHYGSIMVQVNYFL
jgi:hypothetical protein